LEIILDHIYSLEVVGVQGLLTSQPLWNRNADAKFGLFYLSVAFLFIWNLQLKVLKIYFTSQIYSNYNNNAKKVLNYNMNHYLQNSNAKSTS
jgi:hypothetical protein